jgi:hypothetical protein
MNLWNNYIQRGNLEMFPLLLGIESEEGYQQVSSLIGKHHEELWNKIKHYFSSLSTQVYDWQRNSYSESSAQPENLTLREEEELRELQSDHALNMRLTDPSLDKFWISVIEEFPAIHRKAIKILQQFSTSYMCEKDFSCLTSFRSKDTNRLISVENKLRVCLSKVRPRIKYLCSRKEAQISD